MNWQTITISIGGYQVWPPSWPLIVGLVALALVAVAIGIVVVLGGRGTPKNS